MAADEDAQHEEEQRLGHAPVLDGPKEVAGQSVAYAGDGHVPDGTVCLCRHHGCEETSRTDVHGLCLRVDQAKNEIHHLNGLDEQQDGNDCQSLITEPDQWQDNQTAHGVEEQDIAVEEAEIQQSKHHQQYHAPDEARTEIDAALGLIVVLDEEAQSEQQGKDRIHLSGQQEEHRVPYRLVECRRFREAVEIHVFDEVDQHDASDGYAAQDIGGINASVGL